MSDPWSSPEDSLVECQEISLKKDEKSVKVKHLKAFKEYLAVLWCDADNSSVKLEFQTLPGKPSGKITVDTANVSRTLFQYKISLNTTIDRVVPNGPPSNPILGYQTAYYVQSRSLGCSYGKPKEIVATRRGVHSPFEQASIFLSPAAGVDVYAQITTSSWNSQARRMDTTFPYSHIACIDLLHTPPFWVVAQLTNSRNVSLSIQLEGRNATSLPLDKIMLKTCEISLRRPESQEEACHYQFVEFCTKKNAKGQNVWAHIFPLRPHKAYRVQISGLYAFKEHSYKSVFTITRIISTRGEAPQGSIEASIVYNSPVGLYLQWRPPVHPNGDVLLYKAEICDVLENETLIEDCLLTYTRNQILITTPENETLAEKEVFVTMYSTDWQEVFQGERYTLGKMLILPTDEDELALLSADVLLAAEQQQIQMEVMQELFERRNITDMDSLWQAVYDDQIDQL